MSAEAPGARAWALLLTLGLLWGSSFMFTNLAVREVPPLTLAAARLIFAAALLWLVYLVARARRPDRPRGPVQWRFALASALLGNVLPFFLISWAQQYIPSALAGLLMAPMPLLSLLLAHFLITGERMTAGRAAGFALGFAGVAVLIGPDAFAALGPGVGGIGLAAQVATLGAMGCYALNGIVLKRAAPVDPLRFSAVLLTLAGAMAATVAVAVERPDLTAISALSWGYVAILGLGATALAQLLIMAVLSLAGPPFLASVNYQVPLWSALFGLTLLGERLAGGFWAALALILGGLALAQAADARRRRRARAHG